MNKCLNLYKCCVYLYNNKEVTKSIKPNIIMRNTTLEQVKVARQEVENCLKNVRQLQVDYFRGPVREKWNEIQRKTYADNRIFDLVSEPVKTEYFEIKAQFIELEERYESAKIAYTNLANRANSMMVDYCRQEGLPHPRTIN